MKDKEKSRIHLKYPQVREWLNMTYAYGCNKGDGDGGDGSTHYEDIEKLINSHIDRIKLDTPLHREIYEMGVDDGKAQKKHERVFVEKMQKNEFLKGKKDLKTQLIDFAIEVVREWGIKSSSTCENDWTSRQARTKGFYSREEYPLFEAFKILYDNKIIKYKDRVYVREIENYAKTKNEK